MTKVTDLTNEITSIADNDVFYGYDTSNPSNPDSKVLGIRFRPPGSKVTNYARYEGNVTVPALAAGIEGDATLTIAGALTGDHVVFNFATTPPADVAALHAWVSASNTVKVRFRNLHASTAYAGAALACAVLVIRSDDP